MIALVGGLGAALLWGGSTLVAGRVSRIMGGFQILAWIMLVGLVLTGCLVLLAPEPMPQAGDVPLLALAGIGNCLGLLVSYAALRVGKVSVVAPIVSTEGAIAAGIAIAGGEPVAASLAGALAIVAVGVVLAAREEAADARPGHPVEPLRSALLAVLAAGLFGVALWAVGRIGGQLAVGWAVLPARIIGVVLVALPLILGRRLRLTRQAAPLVIAGGAFEVVGTASFALGAAGGVAVASVIAAQFAAVAAVGAWLLLGERLARIQVVGILLVVAGTTLVAVLRS